MHYTNPASSTHTDDAVGAIEPLAGPSLMIEAVYRRLVDAIVSGLLAPGQHLRQEELAERLQVSRQPISHALQLLKRDRLVEERGRRGLCVTAIDARRLLDIYAVRARLDGLAAQLAADRATKGQLGTRELAQLHEALRLGQSLPSSAPDRAWIAADVGFHAAIYAGSGNPEIASMLEPQWPHLRRTMGFVLRDPGLRPRLWAQHAAILEAIVAGLPEQAEALARHHAEAAGAETAARLQAATAA